MKNRLMESQQLLRDTCHEAIGIYMAKEPSEKDAWRDASFWNVVQHTRHEFEEVLRSGDSADRKYHNLCDLIGLIAMVAVKVREEENEH